MNEETKTQDTELETGAAPPKITVKYSTLVEGIGMVFTGVAKMLSALDASTAHLVAEAGDALREQREEQKAAAVTERQDTEAVNTSETKSAEEVPDAKVMPAVKPVEDDTPPWEETVSETAAEQPKAEKSTEKTANPKRPEKPAITQDDITKIIVRKLKQNRSNNTKIGAILKAHGVARVSDLPESKYEAFLTDLSQI